jgi:GrpB-like predicted nucleotidyltransferase (UPF0157 family)
VLEIIPYQPGWPIEFKQIAAQIRAALGNMALRIDHIGSTSVPGLDAKDIIDVQVSVAQFDAQLEAAFLSIGYTLAPEITADHLPPYAAGQASRASEWEKRYFRPPPGQRPTHLHVRILGHANQRYALLFRDYLCAAPTAAAAYGAFKHRLVEYHADDRRIYTLIKDPVCDIIMVAAEDWAERTHWIP